mmetsp:Transcript_11311/g.20903  ORF Transcript_11311/g.20903 Transcript_11311/m.20903 type:complete len:242 (-) Transcript_11311:130-855(-)
MYSFDSQEARQRWEQCRPLRIVNHDLGYPIVVCGDDGLPIPVSEEHPSSSGLSKEAELQAAEAQRWNSIVQALEAHTHVLLEARTHGSISGKGVFTLQDLKEGQLVGMYGGTVYTEERWDALEDPDENFLFNLNDGAHGVVLDGSTGEGLNALQYLNHSCEPNVIMQEAFLLGSWHVVVLSLREIRSGEELVHDFNLHTEDELEAKVDCTCGSAQCRGKLFRYFPWGSDEEAEIEDTESVG